jgi:hypothetical protein
MNMRDVDDTAAAADPILTDFVLDESTLRGPALAWSEEPQQPWGPPPAGGGSGWRYGVVGVLLAVMAVTAILKLGLIRFDAAPVTVPAATTTPAVTVTTTPAAVTVTAPPHTETVTVSPPPPVVVSPRAAEPSPSYTAQPLTDPQLDALYPPTWPQGWKRAAANGEEVPPLKGWCIDNTGHTRRAPNPACV